MIGSLREMARALGGDVVGAQVLAPGPGHDRRDRSLSVKISASSPDNLLCHSFAGDDFKVCRDYVRSRLGLDPDCWKRAPSESTLYNIQDCSKSSLIADDTTESPIDDLPAKSAAALALWAASVDPRATPVETYLASRALYLTDDIAGDVIRWNPRIGAMVAIFRNIVTAEPQAISRTYLDAEARKIERKFLGPVGGAAVMLDAEVLLGLHVGEGVETCLAARQLGLRPAWALGSKCQIAKFPVLSGIETLTILAEPDAEAEVTACAARWYAARGREVLINRPSNGKDLNDVVKAWA